MFDESGGWELPEWSGGDGDPTMADCGSVVPAPEDAEDMCLAVSELYDEVTCESTLLDYDTLRWGSKFGFYHKMV